MRVSDRRRRLARLPRFPANQVLRMSLLRGVPGLVALSLLVAGSVPAQPRPARRAAPALPVAAPEPMTGLDSAAIQGMRWREIGPYRGGRSVAVAGSASRPLEYWMGTTGGGVFKTTDGGMSWRPVTDRYFGGTIGAIGVAESNPDIVYVGGGETPIRGNTAPGDGLWKTTDGGRTWTKLPLPGGDKQHIARIRVHPTNPDIAWMGILGHVFGRNPERGVFKTTDGGKTWRQTLRRAGNDSTGVTDLVVDPGNPDVLYAGLWEAWRNSWSLNSGGPGSGIFKSTDGGETWTEITRNPGLPKGTIGNIGLAVSGAKSSRVWAILEADGEDGGVYRSDDAGATWTKLNTERKLRQRAWYYTRIYADPKDTNRVYVLNVGFFRSDDGGRTFPTGISVPHGDNHDLWIAPNDPNRMVEGNDGGANVSFTGGRAWTGQQFATAQMYHVSVTNDWPYHVCGAQQDNSTYCAPSRAPGGIGGNLWYDAGGGESGYVTPHPTKRGLFFAGSYGGLLTRKERETGFTRNITVWPDNPMGYSSEDIKHRFQWTFPIVFSPHDPKVLYAGGSELWRSTDEGASWSQVNATPLVRADRRTMGASGGPITKDQTGVETYATIFTFAESPVTAGVLWTGSDDGQVSVSRDNGRTWRDVTPADLAPGRGQDFARMSIVEPSPFDAGTAYLAANRFGLNDFAPYLYRTTDYGASWTRIDAGIPRTEFTRTVRADPVRRGLLYAGTERGAWVSLDDGASWRSLRLNLPPVPVHDLVVKDGDLVAGTHGRSFWILDDLTPLRQVTKAATAKVHLYQPRDPYRANFGGGFGEGRSGPTGANPPGGAVFHYHAPAAGLALTLAVLDSAGRVIREFASTSDSAARADSVARARAAAAAAGDENPFAAAMRAPRLPNRAGHNTYVWNLRYPDATSFDGMILWAAGTTGPLAPPGRYQVRLVAGADTTVRPFQLRPDPRSSATPADFKAQFAFLTTVRDRFSEANDAVAKSRFVKGAVTTRATDVAAADSAEFGTIGRRLAQRLDASEGEIYQVRNRSGQDPLNYPIKLNNKIGALMGTAGQGDYAPTAQSRQVFQELSARLQGQLDAQAAALAEELPKLNALLRRNGKPPIEVPRPKTAS
ncbi:MAG: glycosyl hydrolase [Gemmatimonadetes bacterium]|nr:glycosyl hydrolase [Gemmatimonadota bacterium]